MGMFDFLSSKPKAPMAPFRISLKDMQSRGFTEQAAKNVIMAAKLENNNSAKALFDIDETLLGADPFARMKAGFRPTVDLKDYAKNSFNLSAALTSLWNQAVATRRDYHLVSEEITQHYLIDRMLRLIVDDVLNKDREGEIISFTSEDKEIQEELDDLFRKFDFNYLLQDLCRDMLNLGEFSLRIEVGTKLVDDPNNPGYQIEVPNGEGITSINDDLDQNNIIAFYEQGWPTGFLHMMHGKYLIEPPHKIAHFIMNDRKHRIAVQNLIETGFIVADKSQLPEDVKKELPDYVRMGRPLFMGVIPKLRELQMLETLIPATKLNEITQSAIVGIKVPANTATESVMAIMQQFEDLLNVPVGLDKTTQQLTVSEILSVAGKVRCIPYFDDGKGSVTPINARKNESVDDVLKAIVDIRQMIMSSIGIPYSLVFGSNDKEKSQELRLFSSYTRQLASIQESLSRGMKQIIGIHLANKGFEKVSKKDFDVKWLQPLTDIAGLEAAELTDAKQELAGRRLDFVDKIFANKLLAPYANVPNIVKWVRDSFNALADGLNLINEKPDMEVIRQQQLADQQAQQQQMGGDFPQNAKDPNKIPDKSIDPSQPSPSSNINDFGSGKDLDDSPQFGLDKKV